jgi:hypothetical protein
LDSGCAAAKWQLGILLKRIAPEPQIFGVVDLQTALYLVLNLKTTLFETYFACH